MILTTFFQQGRIPLHYVGATPYASRIWEMLTKAGSEIDVKDLRGRTPNYYKTHSDEINLPGGVDNSVAENIETGSRLKSQVDKNQSKSDNAESQLRHPLVMVDEHGCECGIEATTKIESVNINADKISIDDVNPTVATIIRNDSPASHQHLDDLIKDDEKDKDTLEKPVSSVLDNILKEQNLEQIGNFIVEGYGELLIQAECDNEQIQNFIKHLPIYIKKMELVQECCKIGDYEELQKCLDRRKLAIARENKSGLFFTPLHIAAAHNHLSVAHYLATRFPETLKVSDRFGRTPLHIAAINPNAKSIYNNLISLGANEQLSDLNGCTAEYYYQHPSKERYTQVMNKFESISYVRKSEKPISLIKYSKFLNEITKFHQDDIEYLTKSELGQPLKNGLIAVINSRPHKPLQFLIEFLSNNKKEQLFDIPDKISSDYIAKNDNNDDEFNFSIHSEITASSGSSIFDFPSNEDESNDRDRIIDMELNQDSLINVFNSLDRDKYGQTRLHYDATRGHSRNSFFQTLNDLNVNIAYRDELYRTARDVATFSQQYENVKAIDKYVLYLAANGETEKIFELLMDGYNHILDLECDENIIECAANKQHKKMVILLQTIELFEKTRNDFHEAIRRGSMIHMEQCLRKCGKDANLLATCKNYTFRCSLHIAVLAQRNEIVKKIIKKFPQTLNIGDNLNRTALHYAMALDNVEQLSTILIKAGANRIAKDLKGRQPSYYFINKDAILHLQHEEQI